MATPPRRVNFFHGQLLTAEDLAAEQDYHRSARYLHNRLHGHGTVSGLDVSGADSCVVVSPGMGIDVLGREIVVEQPLTLSLDAHEGADGWTRDLVIAWQETPEGAVPRRDGGVDVARWVESPELALVDEGEAPVEALVLARLTWTGSGEIEVDSSVRRPLGPA
jgi:hypothetical protein